MWDKYTAMEFAREFGLEVEGFSSVKCDSLQNAEKLLTTFGFWSGLSSRWTKGAAIAIVDGDGMITFRRQPTLQEEKEHQREWERRKRERQQRERKSSERICERRIVVFKEHKMIIKNQWISVETVMPPAGKWVLVCASGAMNCMWWSGNMWQDIVRAEAHNIVVSSITHWMHLPEPPDWEHK
jgi:hypothetical protein